MPRSRVAGLRPLAHAFPSAIAWLCLIPACSVFIDLDGEGVRPAIDSDDVNGFGGESGGGSSVGGESGGRASTGGNHSGGTDGSGGGGTGGAATGGTGGTGGEPSKFDLPKELHYWKLDERMGGTALDVGYMRADANVVQTDDWSPNSGVKLGAFEVMDAPSNYIQMSNAVLPDAGTFSLSWWVSPTSFDDRYLVSKQGANSEGGFFVIQTSAGMRVVTGGAGVNKEFAMSHALPRDGSWSHLVMTYGENFEGSIDRLRFYLDGKKILEHVENISSGDARPTNTTQVMRFGAVERNMFPMYTGLVDEVRIYEVELSEEQAVTLHRFDLGQLDTSEVEFYDPRVP